MNSILAGRDFYELSHLLRLVSDKLETLRPPHPPSEQNLWWRRPLPHNEPHYNSFRSVDRRHSRRDRHWARFAGPFDQRVNYMYNLQPNSGVQVKIVTDGCVNSDESVSESDSECGESESECAESVSESQCESGDLEGACAAAVSKPVNECAESENVSVSKCDGSEYVESGNESDGECGPVCMSLTCPCRSKSTSQGETTVVTEEPDSDQWSTESDSGSEGGFIPNWAWTTDYFLNGVFTVVKMVG
jgi:hypothetical protein